MNIIKVKYVTGNNGDPKLSEREYTYFSEDNLRVGDFVMVPVRDSIAKAMATTVAVPESEIEAFKDKVKTIPAGSLIVEGHKVVEPDKTIEQMEKEADESLDAIEKKWEEEAESELTEQGEGEASTEVQIVNWRDESLKLLDYAKQRTIAGQDDMKLASDDLTIISRLKKAMEERRKELLLPHQNEIKIINDMFKDLMEPVNQADTITREKMTSFNREQSRIRQEQEEINRMRLEAAQKEASLNNGELSESVQLIDVSPEVSTKVSSDLGTTGTVKVRKWEIVNFSAIPDEYKLIDAGKVTKLVKAGIGSIPGIRIYEDEILRVNTR